MIFSFLLFPLHPVAHFFQAQGAALAISMDSGYSVFPMKEGTEPASTSLPHHNTLLHSSGSLRILYNKVRRQKLGRKKFRFLKVLTDDYGSCILRILSGLDQAGKMGREMVFKKLTRFGYKPRHGPALASQNSDMPTQKQNSKGLGRP